MKLNILIIILVSAARVSAQVTISAIPPGPRFSLEDLWNVTVMKTTPPVRGQQFQLSLNLYDSKGSKILNQTSRSFNITGNVYTVTKFSLEKVTPVQETYYQKKFQNQLAKQGGMVPEGDYKVEFILNQVGTGNVGGFSEPLVKTTYLINAMLSYPIQLVNVPNNDTITDQYPNFTWLPPFPLPDGVINYEITISEILPDQTPLLAVKNNMPLAKKTVLNTPSLAYNATNPVLIKGKEYGWTVTAFGTNGEFVSGSETWRFVYDYGEDSLNINPPFYYLMDRELSSSIVYIDSNLLPLKFPDEYIRLDSIVSITITNDNDEIVGDEEVIPLAYGNGSNYTYINMCPDEFDLENGLYILEIVLVNQQKYYLRFRKNSLPDACY